MQKGAGLVLKGEGLVLWVALEEAWLSAVRNREGVGLQLVLQE